MTDLEEEPTGPRLVPLSKMSEAGPVTGTHVISEDGKFVVMSIEEYQAIHAQTLAELWADRNMAVNDLRRIVSTHSQAGVNSALLRNQILMSRKTIQTIDSRYPPRKK